MSTGWTFEYVGWNVDLPRLASMNRYWKKYPPIQVLLAMHYGYKPTEDKVVKTKDGAPDAQMAEFMSNIPQYKFIPPEVKTNG